MLPYMVCEVNMLGFVIMFIIGFIIGYICGYKVSYEFAYMKGRRHGYNVGFSECERIKSWPKGSGDRR